MLLLSFSLYLAILIVLSKVLSRRMSSLGDFFLAGRTLPAVAIALTFVASWFGAGSTIGSMNQAFEKGLSALWLIAIPSVVSCLVVGLLFARKVRQLEILSQPEAVERRYGPLGSLLLAWIILASITTFIASQLVAAGHLLEATMGLSPGLSVALILAVVVLYSVIGGYRAVVMTDVFQFICFTLAVLVLFAFSLWGGSGFPQVTPQLSSGFWNVWGDWQSHLAMGFTFVLAWSIAPEMWQRMSSSRTPQCAQRAALMASIILAGLYLLVITTGLMAVYHLSPQDGVASKNVLMALAMALPSPVLTAIVLVGVLSAITSTLDSSLNVGSLTLTRDIVHRHVWPGASPEQLVRLSRLATAVIGIPAAMIALYYQSIIQILWISADIYASTMFVPILGLFYIPNSGRWSGIGAMVLGAIPVILNFLKDFHLIALPVWWPAWPYTTLLGVGLSLVGFGLGWAYHRLGQSASEAVPMPAALPEG